MGRKLQRTKSGVGAIKHPDKVNKRAGIFRISPKRGETKEKMSGDSILSPKAVKNKSKFGVFFALPFTFYLHLVLNLKGTRRVVGLSFFWLLVAQK